MRTTLTGAVGPNYSQLFLVKRTIRSILELHLCLQTGKWQMGDIFCLNPRITYQWICKWALVFLDAVGFTTLKYPPFVNVLCVAVMRGLGIFNGAINLNLLASYVHCL